MMCPVCAKGRLIVRQTYTVGGETKIQERRCEKCPHTATHAVVVLKDERSAFKIAKSVRNGRESLDVALRPQPAAVNKSAPRSTR